METFNIKKILVPVDFSETSMQALNHAIYLAKLNKAAITLLNVTEIIQPVIYPVDYTVSSPSTLQSYEKDAMNRAKKQLVKLVDTIKKKDKIEVSSISSTGWIKDEIIEASEKMKADLIVMGTHGAKGFREFIIGSNTFRVVNEAKCPVLSIQKHWDNPGFKNILVPFRDKPHSREKVDYAIKMAEIYGAVVNVLGIDVDDDKAEFKKITKEAEQIKKLVEKRHVTCNIKVKTTKYLASDILKYAEKKDMDLIIVMSDLDRMRISEYFIGPFCQQMVNHSRMPVLSIRPAFNPDTIDLHGYGW